MYDYIIIGAGVIGSTIARELSRYDVKVLLLEKENDVSCGASKANSGIVHGGFDDKPGTVKAKMCHKGNRMFEQLESELHFGLEMCGSLIMAFEEEEFETLNELMERGITNGIQDLVILDHDQVMEMEPYVNPEVKGALYCPSSGITSPFELTIALAENAVANGVDIKLNAEVVSIEKGDIFKVSTIDAMYEAKVVINAAGAYSNMVAGFVGADNFKIIPRRGEYILLNKNQGYLANKVLFQCPTKAGKGILVTRTYHGNLMLGPNAQEVSEASDVGTTLEALTNIVEQARKSVADFDLKKTLTSFSGIRATSDRHDFIIEESAVKNFINVAGIESPGLTSSPAIGLEVIKIIKSMGYTLKPNPDFNPNRKPTLIRKSDDFDGSTEAKDPKKHIVCRCENVTEAEIVDAIHRGIPVNSIDSMKRRVRAGMGLCQGAYCGQRVAAIIARELKIPLEDVPKRGGGSSTLPHRESRWFYKEIKKKDIDV